jgi:O-succinylbenzoate synthase
MTTKDGKEPIRLLNVATGKEEMIAAVPLSSTPDFTLRVDAHPAWDRSGRYVIFNAYEGETRNVFIADLKGYLECHQSECNGH